MGRDARRPWGEALQAIIVDPDRLLREAMCGAMRSVGADVVASGSRASELGDLLAEADVPNGLRGGLVVVDFPLGDAEEGARWKALIRQWPALKFVYVSRQLEVAHFAAAFDLGFAACLSKNLSIDGFHRLLLMLSSLEPLAAERLEAPQGARFSASRSTTASGDEVLRFTRREASVLKHLAGGASNKRIARELGISEATVKVKVRTLLRKINVTNRTQAATWAVRNGIPGGGGDDEGADWN